MDAWLSIRCGRRTSLRDHPKCRRLVYLGLPKRSRVSLTGAGVAQVIRQMDAVHDSSEAG